MTEVAQIYELLFSNASALYQLLQKMGWATFWATFLQTHLVTLMVTR
jgi:hypothetical protein